MSKTWRGIAFMNKRDLDSCLVVKWRSYYIGFLSANTKALFSWSNEVLKVVSGGTPTYVIDALLVWQDSCWHESSPIEFLDRTFNDAINS